MEHPSTHRTRFLSFSFFGSFLHRSTSLVLFSWRIGLSFLSQRQRHAWATCTTSKADAEGTSTWGFFLSRDTQRFNFSCSGTRWHVEEESGWSGGTSRARGYHLDGRGSRRPRGTRTGMFLGFGCFCAGLGFCGFKKEPYWATTTQATTGYYRRDMGNQCSGTQATLDGNCYG
jgi:hypothetical protein